MRRDHVFIRGLVDGHTGRSHFGAVTNNVAVDALARAPAGTQAFSSRCYVLRRGLARSYGSSRATSGGIARLFSKGAAPATRESANTVTPSPTLAGVCLFDCRHHGGCEVLFKNLLLAFFTDKLHTNTHGFKTSHAIRKHRTHIPSYRTLLYQTLKSFAFYLEVNQGDMVSSGLVTWTGVPKPAPCF